MTQNTAVTKPQDRSVDPVASLQRLLSEAMPELKAIAPRFVNVTRMVQLAIEAKMRNPLLAQCSPVSVLNFCKKCAESGTDRVGAGGMWAVPFWNHKTHSFDMTPIPDWRLLVEKAKKAKAITHATAEAVYENDDFVYERGMAPNLVHRPARQNRGKLVAVYCVYVLPDNTKDFVVMDWETEIVPIRDRTNAWKAWLEKQASNPWVTDPAEQAKKTVVKRAMKLFEGASIELTHLLDADNVVNGYAETDLLARAPIAMPVALPAADTTSTQADPSPPAPGGQGTTTQPPAPQTDEGSGKPFVAGVLSAVSDKKTSGGKPRWSAQIDDQWYSTFDSAIGAVIMANKGQPVRIVYSTRTVGDKKYHDIETLQPVGGASAPVADGGGESEDRETLIAELDELVVNAKASKLDAAMKAAGIDWQDDAKWSEADTAKLTTLRSLLRG